MKTLYLFRTVLFYTPLCGVLGPLFFIAYAIISLNSFDIFDSDPKRFNVFNLYDIALYLNFIGTFSIPISAILIIVTMIRNQMQTIRKLDLVVFLIGTFVDIYLIIFSELIYIEWFFD